MNISYKVCMFLKPDENRLNFYAERFLPGHADKSGQGIYQPEQIQNILIKKCEPEWCSQRMVWQESLKQYLQDLLLMTSILRTHKKHHRAQPLGDSM